MKGLLIFILLVGVNCLDASCVEGETQSVVGSCNKFLTCGSGNTWIPKNCPPSKSFDPEDGKCKFAWDVNCVDAPKTCENDGEKMPVPGDCSSYFQCNGNTLTLKSCGMWLRFDQITSSCRFWFNVDCSELASCSGDVKIPVDDQCQQYRQCIGGVYKIESCGNNKYLDVDKNECREGKDDCSSVKQCLDVRQRPVQGDSSSYVLCSEGKDNVYSCPFLHRFDAVDLSCKWFWSVKTSAINNECTGITTRGVPGNCFHYYECHGGYYKLERCPRIGKIILEYDCNLNRCVDSKVAHCCPLATTTPLITSSSTIPTSITSASTAPTHSTTDSTPSSSVSTQTTSAVTTSTSDTRSTDSPASSTKATTISASTSTPATTTIGCTNGAKKGSSTDCRQYSQCTNGKWVSNKCSIIKHFDCKSQECSIFEYTCCT